MSEFHVGFEIELPLVTIESYMSHRCYTAFKYAFLRSYIHADFRWLFGIPPSNEWVFFYSVYHLYQGMYKNRVENDRKFYEIPALLSCEWGNSA